MMTPPTCPSSPAPRDASRRRSPLLLLGALLAALVAPSVAQAAGKGQAALEEFQKGRAAYYEGRYEDAIKHYDRALELKYSSKLHYNIALAFEKLGQTTKAIASYNRYLKEEPGAGNYAEVQKRVTELEAQARTPSRAPTPLPTPTPTPAPVPTPTPVPTPSPTPTFAPPQVLPPREEVTVDFGSMPSRAELFLEGKYIGLTPLRVNLAAGERYQARVEKRGYTPWTQTVQPRLRQVIHVPLVLADRTAWMTRSEWFSLEPVLGIGPGVESGAMFGINLVFLTFKWRHFFWTINEVGGVFGGGHSNAGWFGTRLGYPWYFGTQGQHQLRLSLGFEYLGVELASSDRRGGGLGISPGIEYRHQTGRSFTIGASLRYHALASGGRSTNQNLPGFVLLAVPMGWSSSFD